jgi:hypothetical protein
MAYALAMIREAAILGDPAGISQGRSSDAIPLLERAFDISDDVAEHDPTDAVSHQRIALAGFQLAELVRDADAKRALDICDRVLRRLRQIRNNTVMQLNEVTALAGSTYPLRALHRVEDARARLDDAFAMLAQLKVYPGAPIKPGSEAVDALTALADHEAAQGNVARAITICQDLVDQVLATGPRLETDLSDATDVSRLYAALAGFQRRAGRSADASATDARRVQLWKAWERTLPGNPFVARQLAGTVVVSH